MHLSPHQIDFYLGRTLSPAELLAVDDHLQTCEDCRRALAEREPLDAVWSAWESMLDDGRTGTPAAGQSRGWREVLMARPAVVLLGVAALTALIVGASSLPLYREVVHLRAQISRLREVGPAREAKLARLRRENAGLRKELTRIGSAEGSAAAVALADSGRRVRIDAGGRLEGLNDLPAAWQREVARALEAGVLERPAGLSNASELAALRGPTPSSPLALLAPVATAVRTDRPTFRWSALPGAREYQVTVVAADLRPAARSGSLAGTEWRSSAPLPRGAVYSWQVVARRGDTEIQAPSPPTPEARFRVLSPTEEAELVRAERLPVRSRLILAVLYARAGLAEDAARELSALARENPTSPLLGRLTASVAPWEPPQPRSPSE